MQFYFWRENQIFHVRRGMEVISWQKFFFQKSISVFRVSNTYVHALYTYYTEHLYLSNLYNYEFLERLGNQADGKSRLWSLKPLEILSVKLGEVCLPIYVNRNLKLSILHSKVRHFEFYNYNENDFLATERHNQSR